MKKKDKELERQKQELKKRKAHREANAAIRSGAKGTVVVGKDERSETSKAMNAFVRGIPNEEADDDDK